MSCFLQGKGVEHRKERFDLKIGYSPSRTMTIRARSFGGFVFDISVEAFGPLQVVTYVTLRTLTNPLDELFWGK
jgi:hypothetical protein